MTLTITIIVIFLEVCVGIMCVKNIDKNIEKLKNDIIYPTFEENTIYTSDSL